MKKNVMLIIVGLFLIIVLSVLIKINQPHNAPLNTPTTTTITGTSQNAKGGAVIVTDVNKIIYIEELDAWPLADTRKHVTATGNLVEKKMIPDPEINSQGEISQGAEGTQTVLEHATWKVTE